MIEKFRYRPEIDGLRAIAVLSVVLYHAGFKCSGGFIGVDIFFVISGFLITSLIWKDLEAGRFTFSHFWERRARRIMPALLVVTASTLLLGWFLLLPTDFTNLAKATLAQSGFAANFYYLRDSGYFSIASAEKPLLHTWSLAVEEQFYFVVPFVLWLAFRIAELRARWSVLSLLALGWVLSFVASVYGVSHFPLATFYLLPTRAWELLTGSVVAFLPISALLQNRRVIREFLALVGLGLIVVPIFKYTSETPFPGLAALPPCLGAALVIWANSRTDESSSTIVSRFLSTRPMLFIGLISYSLYLWHWPLLAFAKYLELAPLRYGQRAMLLAMGVLLAFLSWKFVETPFRVKKVAKSKKSIFAFSGLGITACCVFGIAAIQTGGFPQRFSPQSQQFANAATDVGFESQVNTEQVMQDKLAPIGVANPTLHPSVVVWGDSHAMAAVPAVDAYLKEKGLAGRAATASSTAPVLSWFAETKYGMNEKGLAFSDAVVSYIQRQKIRHVILVGFWGNYVELDNNPKNSTTFTNAMLATIRKLKSIGCTTWFVLDCPKQTFNVPRALSRSIYSPEYIQSLCSRPTRRDEIEGKDPDFLASAKAAGARIINPKPLFLDPTGQHYIIEKNETALYIDNQHLSAKGAKLLLLPLFRKSLKLE